MGAIAPAVSVSMQGPFAGGSVIMSWRAQLSRHVRELRFLVSPTAPSSAAVRWVCLSKSLPF